MSTHENTRDDTPPFEWREPIADHRLLRLAEVRYRIGFSYEHIRRLQRWGKFPKCIKLGERSIAWRGSDIRKWIEAREGARAA